MNTVRFIGVCAECGSDIFDGEVYEEDDVFGHFYCERCIEGPPDEYREDEDD